MKTNENIQKLKDKSFVIKATISKEKIASTQQETLLKIQKNFKTKGFRPGQVPLDIVKQNIDPKTLLEEVIQDVLSENYNQLIKENDLHPIVDPQVKIITTPLDFDVDWEIEYKACELPDVEIDPKAYEEIKTVTDKDINKIFDVLAKNSKIDIPEMLKEKEQEWKINLIIDKIAFEKKLEVSSEEIRRALEANPDLAKNINLTFYLMRQQKVIQYLKDLINP
jgi:FKBP-type peptidyl-prolyl cis-trans isomerase (trigger factor)